MPRRMIDSEIWLNEKFGHLNDPARLLFIGMFNNADDDGRLKASPSYLKALIFPYDELRTAKQVKEWRDLCEEQKLINIYSKNGTEYLHLPGWLEHQTIRKDTYHASKLPPPDKNATAPSHLCDNAVTEQLQSSDNDVTNSQRNIDKTSIDKRSIYSLFELWNSLKIIQHSKLTDDTKRALEIKSKDYSKEDIVNSMNNYAEILFDDQYYFKYKWTLKDFLRRGLDKFLDIETARGNYRRDPITPKQGKKEGKDAKSQYESVN